MPGIANKEKKYIRIKRDIMKSFSTISRRLIISCIDTEMIFLCMTIKSSEEFGRQYKYLDALLHEYGGTSLSS